jgi:hypothetical protein
MFIACALFGACAQAAVSGTIPAAAAVATTSPVPATTPAGMIACYNGPMETANTAYSMFPAQQDGAACVCASYQYKCSKGDTSCSAAEAALGTSKYAYIWTLAATCSTMASMPDVYSNVLCCSEDRCNKPDVAVDPTTKVRASAADSQDPCDNHHCRPEEILLAASHDDVQDSTILASL